MLKLPAASGLFAGHTTRFATVFSLVMVSALALIIRKRKGSKKVSTCCMNKDMFEEKLGSFSIESLPTKKPISADDLERETEFLLSRLYLSEGDASAGLLIALANNFARQPDFTFIKEKPFSDALRKHCVSSNEDTSTKAMLTCLNFFRSKMVHKCQSLLNLFFAKLRFLRYVQDYEQLTVVLDCLANAALDPQAGTFFLPSIDLIAEIVSHQGDSKISSARVAGWKILCNLVSHEEMIPSFMKMPWQWMVAINCDPSCETRRIQFLGAILNHYILNKEACEDIVSGDLLAVLISPVMHTQLKTRFSIPAIPSCLEPQAYLLRHKLDQVFVMTKGEERLKAAYGNGELARQELEYFAFDDFRDAYFVAPRLLPDPNEADTFDRKKFTYPHHLFEEWDELTLRDAAVRAVNWYNRMSSRCDFPLSPILPVALQFVDKMVEYDYIGEKSRDWSIFLSDSREMHDRSYLEIGQDNSEIAHGLPATFLGPELQGKRRFRLEDAPTVLDRMNVILDEAALLCPSFYQDVMRLRECSYASVLSSGRASPPDESRELGLVFRCMNCVIPDARTVNPHRPLLHDRQVEVDESDLESEEEDERVAGLRESILPNKYYDSIGEVRPSEKDNFRSDVSCDETESGESACPPALLKAVTNVARKALDNVDGLVERLGRTQISENASQSHDSEKGSGAEEQVTNN